MPCSLAPGVLIFYLPCFANLGEQPVYKKELYVAPDTAPAPDMQVFGFQRLGPRTVTSPTWLLVSCALMLLARLVPVGPMGTIILLPPVWVRLSFRSLSTT